MRLSIATPNSPSSSFLRRTLPVAGLVTILTLTGCQATYMRAEVEESPLRTIAEQAEGTYTVFWHGENHLHLRSTMVYLSVLTAGWTTVHADLRYEGGDLLAEIYTRTSSPLTLFMPYRQATLASPGPRHESAWLPRSAVWFSQRAKEQILGWAGLRAGEYAEVNDSVRPYGALGAKDVPLKPKPAPRKSRPRRDRRSS